MGLINLKNMLEQDFYSGFNENLPNSFSGAGNIPFGGFDLEPVRRFLGNKVRVASLPDGRLKLGFSDAVAEVAFYNVIANQYNVGDFDIEFDPDLLAFKPPEELTKKSKNPLWVIKPMNHHTVVIQRTTGI